MLNPEQRAQLGRFAAMQVKAENGRVSAAKRVGNGERLSQAEARRLAWKRSAIRSGVAS